MLKRLLLSAVILSAVSVSSYAVDVNIPGADPSIPKDVYVQGVYSTCLLYTSQDIGLDMNLEKALMILEPF